MRSMEGLPTYSLDEISKHTSIEDAWIIISGKVLDISTWITEHPGGEDVLLEVTGRDATQEFEDVGHSGDARSRLDSMIIGTVGTPDEEETRPSRAAATSKRKSIASVSVSRTQVYDWVNDNLSAVKRVGTYGFGGAVIVGAAIFLRRYGIRLFSWKRR